MSLLLGSHYKDLICLDSLKNVSYLCINTIVCMCLNRQAGTLSVPSQNNSPVTPEQAQPNTMPQQPGNIARNTAQVHPFTVDRPITVSNKFYSILIILLLIIFRPDKQLLPCTMPRQ